ncbi:MAG TPA: hypothetical protein VGI45_25005 [Terracidiphilus sp.]|jgi:hypothetical protein
MKPIFALGSEASGDPAASLQTANVFPVLGRAMLGIAGAYLLRALAEAGAVPKVAVAVVAIAYAFAWLVWAARAPRVPSFVPLVYAGTSTVILMPMLWEMTLHFRAFAPGVAAGALATFVVLSTTLEWRHEASLALWLSYAAAAATAIALSVAARSILPFVFTLLLIVLLCESARILGRARPMWPFVAVAADAAIWGMIFVYSGPQNARAEYPDLSPVALIVPAVVLFAITATTVASRAIWQECKVSVFAIAQGMITFGLAISSVLHFAPGGAVALGVACLALSAAAYGATFHYPPLSLQTRNLRMFSMWSAALLIAGVLWAFPEPGAGIALAIAGLAAYVAANRIDSYLLALHGAAFLCTAVIVSGVAHYVFNALAASTAGRPDLSIWIIACSATAAYAVASDRKEDGWPLHVLHLVPALLAASAICALLVHSAVALANLAMTLENHHVAFLRTLVISAVALCLAFAGSRWGRIAMTRLAYVALAFIAAKLLFEDLRHGHMEFIAGSIFLFALTLIAVPRLVRLGAKSRADLHAETAVHTQS